MERLTERLENGKAVYSPCGFEVFGIKEALDECVGRLAAYEDTMPLERAQELAQAEKDGQLVVLPARRKMLEYCPMRHPDNGNCTPAGGFCKPDTEICKALHTAYECGLHEEAEAALKKREADNEAD